MYDDEVENVEDARRWREQQGQADIDAPIDPRIQPLLRVALKAELKTRCGHLSDDDLDDLVAILKIEKFYTDEQLDVDRIARLAGRLAPCLLYTSRCV